MCKGWTYLEKPHSLQSNPIQQTSELTKSPVCHVVRKIEVLMPDVGINHAYMYNATSNWIKDKCFAQLGPTPWRNHVSFLRPRKKH
jgi:hypothetical protein